MGTATLTIDLSAIIANWRALARLSGPAETAAVLKADAYGLGAARVGGALARAGVASFFVALAEEGRQLRQALGSGPEIHVFSGHMAGDGRLLRECSLSPLLNSVDQFQRHHAELPGHPFGLQLDTGMNRLGLEADEFAEIRACLTTTPALIVSHLACADETGHPQNLAQRAQFVEMTEGLGARRSLAATGGVLLGPEFHFDLTRPGIGLFGGLPFAGASPVVSLSLPVIQTREVAPGESVGYGSAWRAARTSRIATLSSGYADGLLRAMGSGIELFAGEVPCPLVGRVSMDLLTVDVSHLEKVPDSLDLLNARQGVDHLASAAGTIGYEILTSLGARYNRVYIGG